MSRQGRQSGRPKPQTGKRSPLRPPKQARKGARPVKGHPATGHRPK